MKKIIYLITNLYVYILFGYVFVINKVNTKLCNYAEERNMAIAILTWAIGIICTIVSLVLMCVSGAVLVWLMYVIMYLVCLVVDRHMANEMVSIVTDKLSYLLTYIDNY